MRRALALGVGLAAGAAALAIVTVPGVAGAIGGAASTAVCSATGTSCALGQGPRWSSDGSDATGMMGRRGNGMMNGTGNGTRGGSATGMRGGGMMTADDLGDGTLTEAQRATLAAMAEEEKLAHDVYTSLAARYPTDQRFTRIAASETRHLEAVRRVMVAYSVTDPTAGKKAGEFATASVADLYDSLLAKATSLDAALAVGRTIEEQDIADLDAAMASVTEADDVDTVYAHLRMASQHHLAAFGG